MKHVPFRDLVENQTRRSQLLKKPGLVALISLQPALSFAVGLDVLTGLNGPQDAAADAIQGADVNGVRPIIADVAGKGLCQSIATGTNRQGDSATPLAATPELGSRCAELVGSADASLTGLPDLNMSAAEVAAALQQVVPEETEIMGSGATETMHDQMNNIESRMQFIRTGTSMLPIAGIHYQPGMTGGAAGSDFSKLGFFINGDYSTGDKDDTFNEIGFDFDGMGMTAGFDYRFTDSFVAGIALGYSESEVDINNDAGSTDGEGVSYTLYGTYYSEQFYVEASLTNAAFEYDGARNINYANGAVQRTIASETDGDQLAWSLGAGYNGNSGQFNYSFYGRMEGVDVEIDAYNETVIAGNSTLIGGALNNDWAMHVREQEVESLRGILGAQMAVVVSGSYGVIQPYAGIELHQEFEDEARTITAFYLNDPWFAVGDTTYAVNLSSDEPDKSFFVVSLGATLIRAGGMQMFFNYDTLLGMEDVSSHNFSLGVRFEL